MKKVILSLMLVGILGFAGLAHADCTQEEAMAKAQEFATKASSYAQSNAEAYAKLLQDNQEQMLAIQGGEDFNALCKFYDDMLAKMQ